MGIAVEVISGLYIEEPVERVVDIFFRSEEQTRKRIELMSEV